MMKHKTAYVLPKIEEKMASEEKSFPVPRKPVGLRKLLLKELKGKIDNRTITKVEYEQYTWNKKFAKHRASEVDDFWY